MLTGKSISGFKGAMIWERHKRFTRKLIFSMSKPNVAERFKANAIALASNFKAINNSAIQKGYNFVRREIAVFVEAYISRLDAKELLRNFVSHSYTYWGEIADRDSIFFKEHAESVFDLNTIIDSDLKAVVGDTRNIVLFQQLLTCSDIVTEKDVLLFWNFFEAMVRLSWKAILEDEMSSSNDPADCWIPKELRNLVLEVENMEDIIRRVEARKSKN
jgi:hypothetical protein